MFGTYLIGCGFGLMALSNPAVFRIGATSQIGRLALGVYAIHYIFVDILDPIKLTNPMGCYIAVLLLSLTSVIYMARVQKLRYLVT